MARRRGKSQEPKIGSEQKLAAGKREDLMDRAPCSRPVRGPTSIHCPGSESEHGEMLGQTGPGIEAIESPALSSDPEPSVPGGEKGPNIAAAERGRIVRIRSEDLEPGAVETNQTGLGADPQESLPVLGQGGRQVGRNFIGDRNAPERNQSYPGR